MFCFLALGLVRTTIASRADSPETQLAGRTVSMEVVTVEDFQPAAWPSENVTLVTESIVIKSTDTIFKLLEERGIRSDTEALTLIYDLNPTVEKLEPLTANLSLSLPRVAGGAQLKQLLQSGHVVALTVDKETKAQFKLDARAIGELSSSFAYLAPARFAERSNRDQTISQVQDLAAWFEHIRQTFGRRTAKPLSKVTLLQIRNEAAFLRSILTQVQSPEQMLSAADQSQISALHADVLQAIEKWDESMAGGLPPGDSKYKVEVTIVGGNADRVKTLRVYFVPRGLFRTPITNPPVSGQGFPGLGAISTEDLPTKNYKVWAAPDGQPLNPATPPADMNVRKSSTTLKISLSMNP